MTREDLQQARKQMWRQDGTAVHTLEDARAWLDAMGWVRIHASNSAAAAPELVTAVAGGLLEDREEALAADRGAHSLLSRLVAEGEAVPLVSEAAQVGATDSGDVLASRRMLAYFYALRGERSPKKAPSSSPLAKEIWQQMDKGSASALSLAGMIGGGITEGAVLRAMRELWVQMRVAPLPAESDDAVTLWTRLDRTWSAEVREGTQTAQPLALSALVSQYLQTAIAASEDELAATLAPWSSRQRVKEILQALTAARELQLVPVERTTHYALAGGKAEEMRLEADERERAALKLAREEHQAKLALEAASAPAESGDGAAPQRSGVKKYVPREKREGRPFAGRRQEGERAFAPRKPFVKREGGEKSAFADRPPRGENPRKFAGDRPTGPRKPFVKREGSERSSWRPQAVSEARRRSGFVRATQAVCEARRLGEIVWRPQAVSEARRRGRFVRATQAVCEAGRLGAVVWRPQAVSEARRRSGFVRATQAVCKAGRLGEIVRRPQAVSEARRRGRFIRSTQAVCEAGRRRKILWCAQALRGPWRRAAVAWRFQAESCARRRRPAAP